MAETKHVGRTKSNKRKVIVAYRVIPGDPEHCLVVHTESLPAEYHDALVNLVESNAGQNAYELAEAMGRAHVPDGRIMLQALHFEGKLTRQRTDQIEMMPNQMSSILLSDLNQLIAEQRGVSVADLALGASQVKKKPDTEAVDPKDAAQNYLNESTTSQDVVPQQQAAPESFTNDDAMPVQNEEPLSDEEIARRYRSQAATMFKEAKRLREEAEKLSPSKKTNKKSEEKNDG